MAPSLPEAWPAASGEMSARLRAFDWAPTSLGALADWSPALRTTVELLLASGLPMALRHGPERRLLYNDAYAHLIGDTHPLALGQPSNEVFEHVDARFGPVCARAQAGETVRLTPCHVTLSRGGVPVEAWFEATVFPWREIDGQIAGCLTIATEITGRFTAEQEAARIAEELRERDARLQMALDSAGMAIWRWDPLRDVGELDERGHAILGLLAGEQPSVQNALARDVHPDDREAMTADFARCIDPAGNGHLEGEYRYRRQDGETFWLRLNGYARFVDDTAGRHAVLVMGTLQDVSVTRGIAAALHVTESRFRMLFDAIDEGFCVIDMVYDADDKPSDYRFVLTNSAFGRQTGLTDVVGQLMSELAPGHEQYWYERYGQILADGYPQRFEMRAEALSRWYEVYAFPIDAPADRRLGLLFNDVSDRRLAESTIRESESQLSALVVQLAEADVRKNEFIATLAHELRNPLSPLTTAAHMLGMEEGDPDGSLRDMIKRQVQHMTRLVDDLLDISRITRGQITLQSHPLDLVGVVDAAAESSASLIEGQGHQLTLRLPATPVPVAGDETRLAQVVANLLNNAAKYTPRGGQIALSIDTDGDFAVVTVQDSGIGLPGDALETVFGMFAQLPDAQGRAQGGLGIGLALARRIAELHGGTLLAQSEGPGRGSRFALRLPMIEASSSPWEPWEWSAPAPAPTAPRRVLVVDDNHDAADSLGALLRKLGHDVRVGYDGRSGLALAESFAPHLALLDIGMPDMDGRALARAIRAQAWGQGMQLAAVSGWGLADDREKSRAAGFDEHLAKPLEASVLQRLLDALPEAEPDQADHDIGLSPRPVAP